MSENTTSPLRRGVKPGTKRGSYKPREDVLERKRQVAEDLAFGTSKAEIVRKYTRLWGLSVPQLYSYIDRAGETYRKMELKDFPFMMKLKRQLVANLLKDFEQARIARDFDKCVEILKKLEYYNVK